MNQFFSHITAHSKYFIIEKESCEPWVPFLNLKVFVVGRGLITKYYRKPTNVCLPLPACSGQAPAVHKTWPSQLIRSIGGLCSKKHHAQEAFRALTDRFQQAIVPILWPRHGEKLLFPSSIPIPTRRSTMVNPLWLPLPYHPSTVRLVQRALNATMEELASLFDCVSGTGGYIAADGIRIAWKNGGTPLSIVLRNLSMRVDGRG